MTYIPTKSEQELRRRFGAQLYKARNVAGLTQGQLAELIGVGPQTISNWERGYYFPDKVDTLLKLASVLKCDPDYLLGRLEESTHDIHFIREITGLSEPAINKICNKELDNPLGRILSRMIETRSFENLMSTYKIFLTMIDNLKESDLNEQTTWYELNSDNVVLGTNEAANHFKQEVLIAMTHVCEDSYSDKVQEIIQDIPTPFSVEMTPGRYVIRRE